MTREIKFRIWNPEEKKMIESGATPMMLHSFFETTARFNTKYEIPYQQFTGLVDKQSKDIYEGDVVRFDFKSGIVERVCEFINSGWHFGGFQYSVEELEKNSEVIGNTYQNKNLLENKLINHG